METITINGSVRQDLGKKATKALRRENLIPCELYGGADNMHFATTFKDLKAIVYTPNFYKAGIVVDGKTREAIIKDIQFHPVTDEILHVDFQELVSGVPVKTEIPVKPIGVATGVKVGGKLMLKVRKLKVKATPENLIDKIEFDVTDLELGSSFKVRDIGDVGMEIMNAPSIPIASVDVPRALRSEESEAEGEETPEGEEAAAEE